MKKVFLAVLAAGLFFACGNDKTNDQANEEVEAPETEVVEAPVAEEPVVEAEAPVVENKAAVAENKSDKGTTVKVDKDGKATVGTENVNVEASKDGGLEIKVNTKGKNSKGNR